MKEECLICQAPLEYLNMDVEMECSICHKKERSKTRCVNGHYVCNECHTSGMDSIVSFCLSCPAKNPAVILNQMMEMPFCHMHGPEHHVMVGAALLTAYKNAGGDICLKEALAEMGNRGRQVPGGACGFWGACGAGISAGMFVSIITGATPLAGETFALAHKMTARALEQIGAVGGPRCCKRDSYLSIQQAVSFVKEELGVEMECGEITCHFAGNNNQCIGKRCPFSGNRRSPEKTINVAVIARFEENETDFVHFITKNESGNIRYKEHTINFYTEKEENIKRKIEKLVQNADKIIVLVNSIDGVTPKMSDMIEELTRYPIIPSVVLNKISDPAASPGRTIDEIDHVLVSANAGDEQFEYPILYLDDENGTVSFDLNESQNDLHVLYDFLVNGEYHCIP